MPGEEILPVKQPPTLNPTPLSLSMKLLLLVLPFLGAGGLFLIDTALFPTLAFLSLLLIGSILFIIRSYSNAHQEKTLPHNTLESSAVTIQQNDVSASQELLTQPPLPAVTPKNRLADFRTFDLSASQSIDFNLRTTVEETVSRFTNIAKEKKIELSCLFSSDSPTPFRGDPGDIRLILMNLIDYTLSSITQGEIIVRGALAQQTPTHATFRFSVSALNAATSSSRVSPPVLPTIETSGYATSSTQHEGGIAISKQLLKTFGGQLEVERTPDLGTTTWFTLTLEKQPPKVFSDLPPRTSLSGIRVLLVSHELFLLDEDILKWGLTYRRVSHLSQAWSMLTTAIQEDQIYDIVLIHCQELEAEALDLATRIRATEALATLRLIFVSTNGKKGDARQIHQAGFNAYLTYPVSSPLLFECLTTVLGQSLQSFAPDTPLITRYTLAEARMRGRSRILIVDSSLSDQKHGMRIVEELGYRADIVVTAREAIEAHAHLPYVAVLLPIQMPGIDGIAAALQIRQQDQQEGKQTLLIGVLQLQRDDEQAQCFAAGMDAVVSKPLLSADLKATIDHYRSPTGEQHSSLAAPIPPQKETAEVNLHEALTRIGGDTELFDEMTGLFFEEYPKALLHMREAVTRQDGQALVYSANALKGALGNFSATTAIDTTVHLELMGRHGDFALASQALADLEKQLTRLHAQLTDFRLSAAA